jgi:hypothetical protein
LQHQDQEFSRACGLLAEHVVLTASPLVLARSIYSSSSSSTGRKGPSGIVVNKLVNRGRHGIAGRWSWNRRNEVNGHHRRVHRSHKELESNAGLLGFRGPRQTQSGSEGCAGYVIVVPCYPLVENVWRGCLSALTTESSLDLRLIGKQQTTSESRTDRANRPTICKWDRELNFDETSAHAVIAPIEEAPENPLKRFFYP